MNLFDLKKNKVTFTIEALLVKEFKIIWDRDHNRDKRNAIEELAYVFFSIDFKSPYMSYESSIRKEKIKKSCISRIRWKDDDVVILNAIKRYDELQQTPSLKLVRAAQSSIDKLEVYFKSFFQAFPKSV